MDGLRPGRRQRPSQSPPWGQSRDTSSEEAPLSAEVTLWLPTPSFWDTWPFPDTPQQGSTGISAPPSEPSSELDRNLSLDWYKWFSRYELVRVWGAGSSVPQKDS